MVNEGYCSWYEFTKAIFGYLGLNAIVRPIKSRDLERLANRPSFSALRNASLERLDLMQLGKASVGALLGAALMLPFRFLGSL